MIDSEIAKVRHSRIRPIPTGKIRIAIVGCGAITEDVHLPNVLRSSDLELAAVCDSSQERLIYLQQQYALSCGLFQDFRELNGRVDAAILALPNGLHAPVGVELLRNGIHVLCEKPLATTTEECQAMCKAADEGAAALGVGFVTRFFPSTGLSKQLIDSHFLGKLFSFDYEEGAAGGWAPLSGYNISRQASGGGVFVVSGSHFMDRMLYLFQDLELLSYQDDACGGVEANCLAKFSAMLGGQRVSGTVAFSKTHVLKNRLRLIGEKGTLEIPDGEPHKIFYFPVDRDVRHEIVSLDAARMPHPSTYFTVQLRDFVHSIRGGVPPRVDGVQATRSVDLMERCYAMAKPLELQWADATIDRLRHACPAISSKETR
jgi:predicted dehydrogenase